MAKIALENLRHSYLDNPVSDDDWALKKIDVTWDDGGAYALLGSSGCGKSTMLNIISGLLAPSEGRILFDDVDVSRVGTEQRNIAQVFQFPVVYDTMTVRQNLSFPLRNRGVPPDEIGRRVERIADILDLSSRLDKRAAGLTADGKQKISLGRGLVRYDVNAILFDEPLTVIDPHLKWQLRSKLKELHAQFGATMIYVTHDQTEALTFADKVVVMHEGSVVQTGTPVELFETPRHTFVGDFIGSPGMNILPGRFDGTSAMFVGNTIDNGTWRKAAKDSDEFEIGIRPEFVRFSDSGIPVSIQRLRDTGKNQIVETEHEGNVICVLVPEGGHVPESNGYVQFRRDRAALYVDGWLCHQGSSEGYDA